MQVSNEMQIGKVGEYLVCADLILKGLIAYPSEQGLPYDVVVDNGTRLIKCQVKTTLKPRIIPQRVKETEAYIFHIKRAGKNKKTIYSNTEIDIFALVCLDTKKIGYLINGDMPCTLNLRVDELKGKYYDEKGIVDYKKVKELAKDISSQTEIAKRLNLHVSQVNRILKEDFKPFQTGARYFSDIERDSNWFQKL